MKTLLETAKVVPAVNQVESHPYLPQISIDSYCKEKGIILTAYSPLGQPREGKKVSPLIIDEKIVELGKKYDVGPGTILISWIAQRPGWNVIPKSANSKRMRENFDIIKLDQADYDAIFEIHKAEGKLQHLCAYGDKDIMKEGGIMGWSLADMGWEKMD